jgi:hypothetical protein
VGASSTEIRARIETTRQRLDETLDELMKELAPNETVARYLRRPLTLALVGAGVVLALVLPRTPPERLLKRRPKRQREPEPEPGGKGKRVIWLLEHLPPRALRALADAGVVSILAKRWLDRRLPRWLDRRRSRASSDGRTIMSLLERRLPGQLSLNGHPKRRGMLRFLP